MKAYKQSLKTMEEGHRSAMSELNSGHGGSVEFQTDQAHFKTSLNGSFIEDFMILNTINFADMAMT